MGWKNWLGLGGSEGAPVMGREDAEGSESLSPETMNRKDLNNITNTELGREASRAAADPAGVVDKNKRGAQRDMLVAQQEAMNRSESPRLSEHEQGPDQHEPSVASQLLNSEGAIEHASNADLSGPQADSTGEAEGGTDEASTVSNADQDAA